MTPLALLFHLDDGTVEVSELLGRRGGRAPPFPALLRRARLPKAPPAVGERCCCPVCALCWVPGWWALLDNTLCC